jgi:hypothetical protein
MPALAIRTSSRFGAIERNLLAAALTEVRDAWSHSQKVTLRVGAIFFAAWIIASAFFVLRPVKKMWAGLCFASPRIVCSPRPAVPAPQSKRYAVWMM